MVAERSEFKLGELVEIAVGGLWGSESPTEKENAPVRVIRGVDAHKMSEREEVDLPVRWVSAKQLSTRTLKVGDVVLESSGACGRSYVIRERDIEKSPIPLSFSNFSRRLVPDPKVNPAYLGYRLRQAFESGEIASYVTGTAMPNLDVRSALGGMTISLPPLSEQRKIAGILGALDDKIELNRRMNTTLEAMARALFQSWFVDFDPVHAKAEGRQPVGMDAETAALFPDSFEDSALGPIPKGWEAAAWSTHMQILTGGTPKTDEPDYWDGDIPWYSVRDVPADGQVWVLNTDKHITKNGLDASAARLLPARTTIISARGTVGKIALTGVPMAMNQSCYGMKGDSGYDQYFTYYLLKNAIAELQQYAYGSVFDTITTETFKALTVCFPPVNVGTTFNRLIEPIMLAMKGQVEEVMRLQSMRDSMLPKLLSGELRVGDAAA